MSLHGGTEIFVVVIDIGVCCLQAEINPLCDGAWVLNTVEEAGDFIVATGKRKVLRGGGPCDEATTRQPQGIHKASTRQSLGLRSNP